VKSQLCQKSVMSKVMIP